MDSDEEVWKSEDDEFIWLYISVIKLLNEINIKNHASFFRSNYKWIKWNIRT